LLLSRSVIDASNLTAAELAKILVDLHANDQSYLEYFEWKKGYKNLKTVHWGCDFCRKVHEWKASSSPQLKKSYDDIYGWWVTESRCKNVPFAFGDTWQLLNSIFGAFGGRG
jgi:hypothetical protein